MIICMVKMKSYGDTIGVVEQRPILQENMSMHGAIVRVKISYSMTMIYEKKLIKEFKEKNPDVTKEQIAIHKKECIDPKTLFQKGTIPTCIWEKNNHTTSKDYIGWHPTTKNIDILERIIRAYSNEEDVVLDIFSGSGSTGVASLRCNRNFSGCEIDPEYYEKSLIRMDESIGLIKFAE